MDNLGNRTVDQVLRIAKQVNCTAESLVARKNEGGKGTRYLKLPLVQSEGTVDFTVQSSTNWYTSIGGHSI